MKALTCLACTSSTDITHMRDKCFGVVAVLSLLGMVSLDPDRAQAASAESDAAASGTSTDSGYAAKTRDAHSTVWERVEYEPDPFGGPAAPRIHRVTELATGLNYKNAAGEYVPSRAVVEPVQGGAAAVHGQTKVRWASSLGAPWPVEIKTPDGKTLRSRVLGVTCSDSTGKSVWLGQVKEDVQGYIVGENIVVYPDCMTGIQCSIRFTYTRAGIEQDLLVEESLEGLRPADLGLDPDTAVIALVSEFDAQEPPRILQAVTSAERRDLLTDEVVDFGALKMGAGKAWLSGGSSEGMPVSVFKRWIEDGGRRFLFEQIALGEVEKQLDTLPRKEGAAVSRERQNLRYAVSERRTFPQPRAVMRQETARMRYAAAERDPLMLAALRPGRALLADYQLMASSTNNFVFTGEGTFYASGPVNLLGVTRIEGNAVLKIGTASDAGISTTNIVCETAPYSPFVVTAIDDNTVGETISGSTGNPATRYYGNIALDLSGAPSGAVLSNIRFSYLSNAVAGAGVVLRDCQVLNCKNAFASSSTAPVLENVLLYRVDKCLANTQAATVTGLHVTAHNVTNFLGNTTGTINLTNCVFSAVNSWQCSTTGTNASVFLSDDSGVFQAVGGGLHYLAQDSPYRDAGSTNLPSDLLELLNRKTSYPPLVYSNATINADLVLGPVVQRDTNQKDLGYLYDPLDYVFGGTHAYGNITFSPGTAVGWFRTSSGWTHAGHGIHIGDQKTVKFDGRGDAPCHWVRSTTVQEGLNGLWTGGYGPGGITGWAWPDINNAPQLQGRFLRTSMLAGDGNHWRDDNGRLMVHVTDSEFLSGGMGGYVSSYFMTNCLFHRTFFGLAGGNTGVSVDIRSSTFIGERFYISRSYAVPVSVRDCAFDCTTFPVTDSYAYNTSVTDYDYNAFISGQPILTNSGANIVLVTGSFDWQQSWLGNFYLPAGSSLIDAGSVDDASSVGMYHYTTLADQTKEGASRLDIGYHYLATDGYGNLLDTDGDGVADYWEDFNGNGVVNSGETDWNSRNDLGLKVLITKPKTGLLP